MDQWRCQILTMMRFVIFELLQFKFCFDYTGKFLSAHFEGLLRVWPLKKDSQILSRRRKSTSLIKTHILAYRRSSTSVNNATHGPVWQVTCLPRPPMQRYRHQSCHVRWIPNVVHHPKFRRNRLTGLGSQWAEICIFPILSAMAHNRLKLPPTCGTFVIAWSEFVDKIDTKGGTLSYIINTHTHNRLEQYHFNTFRTSTN